MTEHEDTEALMALDLEYRLTIAHRIGCDCAPYFVRRREVLIPAVLEQAAKDGDDPVDAFAAFARKVHDRHGGNDTHRIAGRFAALMALVADPPPPAGPAMRYGVQGVTNDPTPRIIDSVHPTEAEADAEALRLVHTGVAAGNRVVVYRLPDEVAG